MSGSRCTAVELIGSAGHRNTFDWSSESIPVTYPAELTYTVPDDLVFPTNDSILGNKSFHKYVFPKSGSRLRSSGTDGQTGVFRPTFRSLRTLALIILFPCSHFPFLQIYLINLGYSSNSSDELLDTKSDLGNLISLSVGSPRPIPCLPSTHSVAEYSRHKEHHLTKLQKMYSCLLCSESFTKLVQLRPLSWTHCPSGLPIFEHTKICTPANSVSMDRLS
jgi:hypothetical protein